MRRCLPPETRFAIWRRDGFVCTYCRRNALVDAIILVIDHIVPVVAGGTNDETNLTTACRDCNARKGPKSGPKRIRSRTVIREHNTVRTTRERLGLSQEELAIAARIDIEQLDAIEREAVEKTPLRVVHRLERALGVQWEPTRLFTFSESYFSEELAS